MKRLVLGQRFHASQIVAIISHYVIQNSNICRQFREKVQGKGTQSDQGFLINTLLLSFQLLGKEPLLSLSFGGAGIWANRNLPFVRRVLTSLRE